MDNPSNLKGVLPFLEAYPFPAFALDVVTTSQRRAISLEPVAYGNASFKGLFKYASIITSLAKPEAIIAFGSWLERPSDLFTANDDERPPGEHMYPISFEFSPPNSNDPDGKNSGSSEHSIIVELDCTRSFLGPWVIITCTPRGGSIPSFNVELLGFSKHPSTHRKRKRKGLKLMDLPTMTSTASRTGSAGSPGSETSSAATLTSGKAYPPTAELFQNYDWGATVLGPRSDWSPELNVVIKWMEKNPIPTAVWWSKDLVLIYNEAYAKMSTTKHPGMYGLTGKEAWGELWEMLGPSLDKIFNGIPVHKRDDLLFFDRIGPDMLPEETYHSWSWIPVTLGDGSFGGILNTTFETTQGVLAERRLATLQAIGNRTAVAQTVVDFTEGLISALQENDSDIPFAAFYLARNESSNEDGRGNDEATPQLFGHDQKNSGFILKLELRGVVAIPEQHPHFSPSMTVHMEPFASNPIQQGNGSTEFKWPFAEAIVTKSVLHVELPTEITKGIQLRGWRDVPRSACILPLSSEIDSSPLGVLILGINTRRTYDEEYSRWADVTRTNVAALLSATKAREEELQRLENLAELDAAKTALFSNASHELRTPLALIGAPIRDVISDIPDGKHKSQLTLAARNLDRLSRLVDSLMDFSRLEAGRLEGRFYPAQFGQFVADLATLFKNTIEKAHIQYTIEYDPDEDRVAFIDGDLMEKIVFNLIGNAFKYTLEGFIRVKVEYYHQNVALIIEDSGVGIPARDIDKIFDRFHRVEATSRSYEGTGIGLALTRQFVMLHGGTISVKSKTELEDPENHGSIFTVTFPLGKDHLPAAHISEFTTTSAKRSYARSIVAEAARWRSVDGQTPSDSDESYGGSSDTHKEFSFNEDDLILLVDDNVDMLEYIKGIFTRYCRVRTASNGRDALEMIHRYNPHLVLSDVMMPVLDGFGLISRIRASPDIRHIPVILLTARATDTNRVEGIMSGADDYIPKPFSSRELIARASLHINLGKKKKELLTQFEERTSEIQSLSDLSPVGICRIDNHGQLLYCNNRFLELTGLPTDHVSDDLEWLDMVHPEYAAITRKHLQSALDNETFDALDLMFSNGTWVKAQFAAIRISSTGLVGLVGTLTDVTVTRLYEQSLHKRAEEAEQRRREAEEQRRSQELLVDVSSHELRQPVSAIINCSVMIKSNLTQLREKLSYGLKNNVPFVPTNDLLVQIDEDLEGLTSIELCGLAQGHIVNDILTLSRMQLNMLNLQAVDFHLKREIQQVCSIMFTEMKAKGIRSQLTFGSSFVHSRVAFVKADKVRFGQVMINLLSNAIRFSQTSKDKYIEINVDVSRSPPTDDSCKCPPDYIQPLVPNEKIPFFVYVSVKDSGPGLQPKDLEILFQRFQRGSNSHEVFGGSGLGLFVSRKICNLLNGRIEVDPSSVGTSGSTFKFYVQVDTIPPPQEETSKAQAIPDASSPIKLKVLVAEDNPINRKILSRQLKSNHCNVDGAEDGRQAVEAVIKAGENIYDCILMDVEMPVMSGLDATREIRRLESIGEIPKQRIIALTANARPEQIGNAMNSGMDELMTKPYQINQLLDRIRETSRPSSFTSGLSA